MQRRRLLLGAGAALASPAPLAQERWPARPVKIIVAFPPGQASDIYARVFAERLTRTWGQSTVVENRPGASSIIGMEAIKGAVPDGYTWQRPRAHRPDRRASSIHGRQRVRRAVDHPGRPRPSTGRHQPAAQDEEIAKWGRAARASNTKLD